MDMLPNNDDSLNDLSKEVVPPDGLLVRAESRLFERIGDSSGNTVPMQPAQH